MRDFRGVNFKIAVDREERNSIFFNFVKILLIMKKFCLLLIAATIVVFSGCTKSVKDQMIGTWKVKSVEGENLSPEELNSASMTFVEDGTFKAKNLEREMHGTWTVAEDEKSMTLKFKEDFEEVWKIQSVTDKELVYTTNDQPQKVTLIKQ